jgi:hypothetical protein
VLAHTINETETNANSTLEGYRKAHASHIGQLFFDQHLINDVETNYPYTTNTQPLLNNSKDTILQQESRTIDPFIEYVYLGDSPADGIFGWISMGMDVSQDKIVEPAAFYTENGGVENENGGWGGPGGSPSR